MKIAISGSILLFSVAGISAQINSGCPKVEVQGPPTITQPGATMSFRAIADTGFAKTSKFEWTVSFGIIESGQGTPLIVVRIPKDANGDNVEATIKVTDHQKGCFSTAKDVAGITALPIGEPVDTYGKVSLFDEYARVQSGVVAAEHDKDSLLLFIRESPQFGQKEKARILALNEFIVNRLRFPKSRYLIINKFGHIYRNTIWIVPPGAKFPE